MAVDDATRPARVTRTLQLGSFRRIELRDPANRAHLVVEPGHRATLEAEGPAEIVRRVRAAVDGEILRITLGGGPLVRVGDALTTSLTPEPVSYRVQAPRIDEVRVLGPVHVSVDAFGADAPVVTRLPPVPPPAPRPARGPRPL